MESFSFKKLRLNGKMMILKVSFFSLQQELKFFVWSQIFNEETLVTKKKLVTT